MSKIDKIMENISKMRGNKGADEIIGEINVFIASKCGGVIRLFIPVSDGTGHQTNSIYILKGLLRYNRGALQEVELLYEPGEADRNKRILMELLPQWDGTAGFIQMTGDDETSSKYLVRISFYSYSFRESIGQRYFGITGGYDSNSTNLAELAKTFCFLVLQPYQWPTANAVWVDKSNYRLFENDEDMYLKFASVLAYNIGREISMTDDRDTMIGKMGGDTIKADIVLKVMEQVAQKCMHMLPVYGITNMNATEKGCQPQDILLNMILGTASALDKSGAPLVMLVMHTEGNIRKSLEKIIKPEVPSQNPVEAAIHDKIAHITDDRVQIFHYQELEGRINLLEIPGKISVIFMERLPQDVFNYMYYIADIPVIFEGKGTFTTVLNFGKPYLVLNNSRGNVIKKMFSWKDSGKIKPSCKIKYYPVISEDGGIEKEMYECTEKLQRKYEITELYRDSIEQSADFLKVYISSVLTPQSPHSKYFMLLRQIYNNIINDKLLIGFAQAILIINQKPVSLKKPLKEDKLDELYRSMVEHTRDETLYLFPEAVSEKYIINTYYSMLGLETVVIENAEITKYSEDSKIIVTGKLQAYESRIDAEIEFRINDIYIETNSELRFPNPAEVFQKFGLFSFEDFKMRISCSSVPLSEKLWAGGTVNFGEKLELGFGYDYPAIEDRIIFSGLFIDKKLSIDSLFQFLGGVNLAEQLFPPFSSVAEIGIEEISVSYNYKTNTIYEADIMASFDLNWKLLPKLEFEQIKLLFGIYAPGSGGDKNYYAVLTGDFTLGSGDNTAILSASVNLPDAAVYVELTDGRAALGDIVTLFMEQTIDLGAYLSDFSMEINSSDSTYSLKAGIEADKWEIKFTDNFSIALTRLSLYIEGGGGKTLGKIGGTMRIGKENGIDLSVLAQFGVAGKGYLFSAAAGDNEWIDLLDLAETFLQALGGAGSVPDWVAESQLKVGNLKFLAAILEETKNYEASGSVLWDLKYHSVSFLQMNADVKLGYSAKSGVYGYVKGDASLLGMDISAGYEFSKTDKNLFVEWLGIRGSYEVGEKDEFITFSVKNKSLGEIISSLICIFDSSFQLAPPWDFLNGLNLDGCSIIYHLKSEEIEVTYSHKIDLAFLCFDSITLVKNNKGVFLKAEGTFLGLPVTQGDSGLAEGRDIKDLPKVPGQGNEILRLKYLGLGQHVSLYPAKDFSGMEEALDALENSFQEPQPVKAKEQPVLPIPVKPKKEPAQPVLLWNGDSKWMIGAGFVLLNSIEIGLIFNDPSLYGLMIRVSGNKLKIFDGLKFEILYKKISDTVGVYQIELQLPEYMRHLEFGAVSVTLPMLALEIYTNGNFKVDFGFPKNLDFSKSFTIQAFPFTGSGGFYFAALNSETSEKVPVTQYGSFEPVIEFGMGLSLGVGKDISAGILKAGLSLTLAGILEGVLGFYHPMQPDYPGKDEIYYNIQGTLGITGIIYGEVDFSIIYARVDIAFYAYIQITIESYNSVPIYVEAGVSVSLTVKINLGLFKIAVSLSFSAKISASFVIGKDERALAPWNYKKDTEAAKNTVLPVYSLLFQPLLTKEKKTIRLYFMPHLTLTDAEGVNRAAYAASLYIPNEDAVELVKGIFLWCVNACINSGQKGTTVESVLNGTVSKDELQYISQTLSESGNILKYHAADGMDISAFMENYFHIELMEPGDKADLEAGVFPVFPDFKMKLIHNKDEQTIDFGSYNLCGRAYIEKIQALIRQMSVDIEGRENSAKQSALKEEECVSVSELIFADYVGIIAGNILQAALEICEEEQQVKKLTELFTDKDIRQVLGMAARFMLGGLSLPSIQESEDKNTVPLYRLTGQLFELPQLYAGDNYEIQLFSSKKQEHIRFVNRYGKNSESISVKLTDSEIARIQNLLTLSPAPVLIEEPGISKAYKDIARVYSLEKQLQWDKMIYLLPAPLQLILKENPDTPVQMYSSETGEISSYTMAVLLNMELKITGETAGNIYEIEGADEQGTASLQKLLKYIKEHDSGFIEEIYFLYYPDKTAGRLVSQKPEEVRAAVVKTNLSTETNPAGRILSMKNTVLNPVEEFLEQLWEASIVRTGGFYLYYRAPEALPDSIFDEHGSGTVKILITCKRTAEEFINCIFSEMDMPQEQESFSILLPEIMERRAVIPQGCAEITCVRKNPGEYTPAAPYPVPATPESTIQDKIYLENQFQLMDYRILEDDIFSPVESLSPAEPVEREENKEDWTYDFVVPLAKHVKGAGEDNPYSGIGKTARIALEWKDIFGCRIAGTNPAYIISAPLLYTDVLTAFSKWTGVTADYGFQAADKKEICFRFHYDSSRYTSGQEIEELQQCLNYARLDALLYQKIRYQLEQDTVDIFMHSSMYMTEDGSGYMDIAVDKQFFIDFVINIRQYLENCALYLQSEIEGTPNQEYFAKMKELLERIHKTSEFTLEIQENNPADIFALTTEVIIKRTGCVHKDFAEVEGVSSVTNIIRPFAERQPDTGEYSFRAFAKKFEEIFKNDNKVFLKLAEGVSEQGNQELWVVRFNNSKEGRGISCILSDKKYYFAPKPLSTELLNLPDIEITEYVSGQQFVPGEKTVKRSFYNIDMDIWAKTLLEAVDFILSPDFAVPLYLCDNGETLKKICDNKKMIAKYIACSMTNIMEEDKQEPECLDMVREKMRQRLLIRLADAYEVSTVAAVAADTGTAEKEEEYPAKLYGSIQNAGDTKIEHDYKFSNAKVPVKCGRTWLTALFEINGQNRQTNVGFENLQYAITHMEHKIEKLFEDVSYLASKWLTFSIPFGLQKDMGKADIPLPLRAYPQPPSVQSQRYEYEGEEAIELSKLRNYEYIFTYQPAQAAQDIIKLWVYFNVEEDENTFKTLRENSLLSALAQFISVYPDIKDDLIKYLAGNEQPGETAVNSAKAFSQILSLVTDRWCKNCNLEEGIISQELYKFDIVEFSEEQGNPKSRLVVEVTDSNNSDLALPLVCIEGYLTENISGQNGSYVFYKMEEETKIYLTYEEGINKKERNICFTGLDILKKQNVWAGIYVARNEQLIAGKRTNPEFIYQTNLIKFGNKLVPLLRNKCEINIGSLKSPAEKRTLKEHLNIFFEELFKDSGLAVFSLKVSCRYYYSLYKNEKPLMLPMYLTVPYPAGTEKKLNEENGFIQQLADKISGWFARFQPGRENGRLQFGVELYAQGSNHMPFLVLENVILRAEDISDF